MQAGTSPMLLALLLLAAARVSTLVDALRATVPLSRASAASAVHVWMEQMVIAHDLCPWAAQAHKNIVMVDLDLDDEWDSLDVITTEAFKLVEQDRLWHTTLCVFPCYVNALPLFQRLWTRCERRLLPAGIHVLAFHPLRRDRNGSECSQFAMRSPVPIIQLLRSRDLEIARATRGSTLTAQRTAMLRIMADNEAKLEALGLPELEALYGSWMLPEARASVLQPVDDRQR